MQFQNSKYKVQNIKLALVFTISFLVFNFSFYIAQAASFEYDLGLRAEDIVISPPPAQLIAAARARIYATVYNFGQYDTVAVVSFFQGPTRLGESQPVSVRAGGFADEVFIDFTTPSGSFNILAKLQNIQPQDNNSDNNEALTPLITPLLDRDSDSLADSADNCPEVANASQADNDRDGQGDACDPDDDNDGLADIDEGPRGTSTMNPDTDGDGMGDAKDRHPLVKDASPLAMKSDKAIKRLSDGEIENGVVQKTVENALDVRTPSPIPRLPEPITETGLDNTSIPPGWEVSTEQEEIQEDQSDDIVIVPQQQKPRIAPGMFPKIWIAAGLSALLAGVFSFLALRLKTPKE